MSEESCSDLVSGPGAGAAPRKTAARDYWLSIAVCLSLALIVWAVFGQTLRFGFVNYDDRSYVYENPQITRGLSLGATIWAFTHIHSSNWHPLTTLTHMLDCQIYGLHPWGHHLGNVLLHAATAILLFVVLRQMTGTIWRSAFVAAVFAIHPLRVESVAWVAERKDVLSGLFFVLTLWAYVRYVRSPRSLLRYSAVLCFFALGLLSKPMLVTLPVVLLLLDYWPLGRLQQVEQLPHLLREKVPFFALSAASCVATVIAQQNAIQPWELFPLSVRVENGLVAYAVYLGKLLYPTKLALLYPMGGTGLVWPLLATGLLVGVTLGVFFLRRQQPFLAVGWLWYLGMLVPVIGIIQVGDQAYADRYAYLPQIGLLIGATWAVAEWVRRHPQFRVAVGALAAVLVGVLSVAAYRQTSNWRDSVTLWSHTLDCTTNNSVAYTCLGAALADQGKTGDAIQYFERALELKPDDAEACNNLGLALVREGKLPEAVERYERALQLQPDDAETHNSLGLALARLGKLPEAIQHWQRALELRPDDAGVYNNLGLAAAGAGNLPEAIQHYERALQLQPNFAGAHNNLGLALAREGQLPEAIQHWEQALQFQPDYAEALNNLGIALARQGRVAEAIQHYERALQLKPDNAEVNNSLGAALASQGKLPEAIQYWERAVQFKSDYAEAYSNLGLALARQGKTAEATQNLERALDLANEQNNTALAEAIRNRLNSFERTLP